MQHHGVPKDAPSGDYATKLGAPTVLAEPDLATDKPPIGTAKEILSWVGADSDRAILALERELDSASPRVTLVDHLYKIVK